jgi:hypothetical protein
MAEFCLLSMGCSFITKARRTRMIPKNLRDLRGFVIPVRAADSREALNPVDDTH